MLRSQGSISILNSNLATGVATPNSTVGLWVGSSEVVQPVGAVVQYSPVKDQRIVTFNILGSFVATFVLQETLDGTNWYNNGNLTPKAGGALAASVTAPGAFQATITCASQVRVTCSAFTSGSASVVMQSTGGY